MIPDRAPNEDDGVIPPFDKYDKSAQNQFAIARWLEWRLTGPGLSDSLTLLMTLEAKDARAFARLMEAQESMSGETLEEKMQIPEQRLILRALTLEWMATQRALIDGTTAALDHRASGNGH